MKRLGRWLFNFAAAVSLVLCVATAVHWVRSYFTWDRGFVAGPVKDNAQGVLDFWSERGRITVVLSRTEGFSLATSPRDGKNLYSDSMDSAWSPENWLGFRLSREVQLLTYDHTTRVPPQRTTWTAVVPHWFVLVITAILPARAMLLWRKNRFIRMQGCCRKCGYDLRATPQRCPECGTVPELQKANT